MAPLEAMLPHLSPFRRVEGGNIRARLLASAVAFKPKVSDHADGTQQRVRLKKKLLDIKRDIDRFFKALCRRVCISCAQR